MTPDRIGRYRIVEELGRGGFATVYLGEDRGLDDLVAIKLLADTHAAVPESVARFVAEARVMRNFRAPGVVTVHDVGEHDGRPYFVMEYCERGTLSARLSGLGRQLTIEEGVGLARAIGGALAGMHGASPPVVHRDIKPDNLLIRRGAAGAGPAVGALLSADEELILGDFGLAKVVDTESTKLSLIAYTRGYAPPEQIRGDGAIEPSADVYSASAVIVAALSGEAPTQVFSDGDRAFSEEALAATGPLRAELQRGLAFERGRRHDTVIEWSRAVATAGRVVAPSKGVPVAAEPLPGPPPPEHAAAGGRSSRVRYLIAAAIAAILAGSIGVIALLGGSGGPTIIGPSDGVVGDELAFAVLDGEVEAWQVGEQRSVDPVLKLTPKSVGRIPIGVVTADGEREVILTVGEPETDLRIVGPGHLPLGEITTLRAEGAEPSALTWVVNGQSLHLPFLEVNPTRSGILRVELATSDGDRVSRTFTVSPATE